MPIKLKLSIGLNFLLAGAQYQRTRIQIKARKFDIPSSNIYFRIAQYSLWNNMLFFEGFQLIYESYVIKDKGLHLNPAITVEVWK